MGRACRMGRYIHNRISMGGYLGNIHLEDLGGDSRTNDDGSWGLDCDNGLRME
jgi:hypothetical protein